jgi:hypothetical protein
MLLRMLALKTETGLVFLAVERLHEVCGISYLQMIVLCPHGLSVLLKASITKRNKEIALPNLIVYKIVQHRNPSSFSLVDKN